MKQENTRAKSASKQKAKDASKDTIYSLSMVISPSLTIETIESLASELSRADLTSGKAVFFDARELEHITTPGVQLIVSLQKTLEQNGSKLVIANHKPQIAKAFQDLGIPVQFNDGAN